MSLHVDARDVRRGANTPPVYYLRTDPHFPYNYNDTVNVTIFTIFEEDMGIMCASAPAMRQLYKNIKSKRGQQRLPEPSTRDGVYSAQSNPIEKKRADSFDVELNAIDELDSRL
ncbi:MAG: hypothetical protein Q9162_001197 [Coniocarpon cinnabarinum]